jgi:arginyl-tRNA synthetase
MIKDRLAAIVAEALEEARLSGELPIEAAPAVEMEMPKSKAHGDWATNAALLAAKGSGMSPRDIAAKLIARLPIGGPLIERAEVAGPGFINLTLRPGWLYDILRQIEREGASYGKSERSEGKKIIVEFVSTNPNGPITVAGGRNAAIGDVLCALLESIGNSVYREYYINDALNSLQMNNFGKSVFWRYLELLGKVESGTEPDWMYLGDYVVDIAKDVLETKGEAYAGLDMDDPQTAVLFRDVAQDGMIAQQKADLDAFGVRFDNWFSEATLHDDGSVMAAIEELTRRGHTYEKDGALWLRSTTFGDDKDRVMLRAGGAPTYIAGDAAYHKSKFDRGYEMAIDVWGADHHSYVARTKAAIAGLGYDPNRLYVLLYQLVKIFKDGVPVMSSKRRGDFLELKADLVDEIGKDAARFFFLMRSPNSDLDIDIDLAKKTEKDNPVYYVQYAHARIVQALEKAREAGVASLPDPETTDLTLLTEEAEIDLIKKLSDYPDEIALAAKDYAPQRLTQYVRDLAAIFHSFYDGGNRNASLRVVCDNPSVMHARLVLVDATRIVLRNALTLMGLSAPDRM